MNINTQKNNGRTALILASMKRREDVARTLVNHDDINLALSDATGMTAFMHAKEKKFHKIVAMIDPEGKMEAKAKMKAKAKAEAKARADAKKTAMAKIEEEKIKKKKKKERDGMPKGKKSAADGFAQLFLYVISS